MMSLVRENISLFYQRPFNLTSSAGKVLDVWCDKMPCVTAPERRKLLALALASLLTSESPVVLSRVYLVLLNVAETLNDVTRYGRKRKIINIFS